MVGKCKYSVLRKHVLEPILVSLKRWLVKTHQRVYYSELKYTISRWLACFNEHFITSVEFILIRA